MLRTSIMGTTSKKKKYGDRDYAPVQEGEPFSFLVLKGKTIHKKITLIPA